MQEEAQRLKGCTKEPRGTEYTAVLAMLASSLPSVGGECGKASV